MNLQVLQENLMKCRVCSLADNSEPVPFLNRGNSIMILGMNPGKEETIMGRPFVGRSGKLLGRMLDEAGIPGRLCYVTNVCRCRTQGNSEPKQPEVDICTKLWLWEEIKLFKPKIIVACGKLPIRIALKIKRKTISLQDYVGKIIDGGDYKVLPIYHPAYLLRANGKINSQIKWLKQLQGYIS